LSEWNEIRKYLLFYAGDEKIIPRRDIRNQLYEAVQVGDRLQERSRLLELCNKRLNVAAMKRMKEEAKA